MALSMHRVYQLDNRETWKAQNSHCDRNNSCGHVQENFLNPLDSETIYESSGDLKIY